MTLNVYTCSHRLVGANMSKRSNIERENNWISLSGLTVDETYWFRVTARDAEDEESPSERKICPLKLRTGKCIYYLHAFVHEYCCSL